LDNLKSDDHSATPVILTLTLNNSQPIELGAFVNAFLSLAKEYQNQISKNPDFESEATIYVKEVRSGSIVADLVPVIATTLPLIAAHAEQVWQSVEFVKKWADRIESLASGKVPSSFGRSDLKTFASAVEAIARDPNASAVLEAATFEDGKRNVRAAFKFSTRDARAVEKTIDAEFIRLDSEKDARYERVFMTFTRSDIKDAPEGKRSGERALIPEILDRDLPIIYASALAEQRVKHEIREADDNIFKKGFVVDVLVVTRNARPMVFKIFEVHDVVDLSDDE
jgi:hypothetical protein